MSTYVYLCLPMSTYVYPCLPMSTYVYLCLPVSIYVYLYVYLCLPMSTYVYLCLPICLPLSSYVYLCLSMFTCVYLCLPICLPVSSYVYLRLPMSTYMSTFIFLCLLMSIYVHQSCGNYSLQIIDYNCHYVATLRTNYHYHYSNITSNYFPLQLLESHYNYDYNCVGHKSGRSCTDCLPSRRGNCSNGHIPAPPSLTTPPMPSTLPTVAPGPVPGPEQRDRADRYAKLSYAKHS